MKKYNSMAIILIVLGVLATSCGPALAESREPFLDEEWNMSFGVRPLGNLKWDRIIEEKGDVQWKRTIGERGSLSYIQMTVAYKD